MKVTVLDPQIDDDNLVIANVVIVIIVPVLAADIEQHDVIKVSEEYTIDYDLEPVDMKFVKSAWNPNSRSPI